MGNRFIVAHHFNSPPLPKSGEDSHVGWHASVYLPTKPFRKMVGNDKPVGPTFYTTMETLLIMTITDQIYQYLPQLSEAESLDVLQFLKFLESRKKSLPPPSPVKHFMTAQDLLASDLVGLWADRDDLKDSLSYARQLREQAQQRDLG
ncbi:MAG: hypothetical protein BWK78_08230 [Thiotrichaceae bacterium IS1]|nr:MAG: hypothetical protein BWK78_08230 [Thiotrichaceae bacterium IS1]